MMFLFSEDGKNQLDEIVKQGMICVFDFDGTLSPIVTRPDRARLPLGVKSRLIKLSGLAPVAIVTGRSIADVRPRLGFEPDYIVGNHGLEGLPGWEKRGEAYRLLCMEWKSALEAALQDKALYDSGIAIEEKQYSLSVHYRLARNRERAEEQLKSLFAQLTPTARVIPGKCVFSLVPPDATNKGSALEELMTISGARSAIYVGDDVTDEDVFRLQRSDCLSIRIGVEGESAAKFFLSHRMAIVQLLDELIRRLSSAQAQSTVNDIPSFV